MHIKLYSPVINRIELTECGSARRCNNLILSIHCDLDFVNKNMDIHNAGLIRRLQFRGRQAEAGGILFKAVRSVNGSKDVEAPLVTLGSLEQ